jgi:hypothetical protein
MTVQKGGELELSSDRLTEGEQVEVIVIRRDGEDAALPRLKSIFDVRGAGPSFDSAEEVDRFIREERDSWDR